MSPNGNGDGAGIAPITLPERTLRDEAHTASRSPSPQRPRAPTARFGVEQPRAAGRLVRDARADADDLALQRQRLHLAVSDR